MNLLRLSLSSDEKYRLWTPFPELPKTLVEATLLQEDRYYYLHPGINPFSLLRGAWSTFVTQERRIGGSTITMQLARMRFGIESHKVLGKIEQIARALQLEWHYTKDEILEAYLNAAPYGGNIEGVGAAAITYFGYEASALSFGEAVTLSVIPKSPKLRAPVKTTISASLEEARRMLLKSFDGEQGLQSAELEQTVIQKTKGELPFFAPHFVNRVLQTTPYQPRIVSTLDGSIQRVVQSQIETFVKKNERLGITNSVALLIDHRSMEVRGYVGSADFFNKQIEGQVDGIQGRRSPGSALKPFIYGLALDQGLIIPETILKDTSFVRATYNPENFDRDFVGPVSAENALVHSRNIPAIRLTNELSSPGFYGFLKQAGISALRQESFYGLSLALGGVEVKIDELGELYAMLANGGELRKLRLIKEEEVSHKEGSRLLSPEAAFLVLEMLKSNPRPNQSFDSMQTRNQRKLPWKTGTSYGFRDAWAAGIVGRYVLVVWVGNFDGKPNPAFIGRETAGPLFFNIADALLSEETFREQVQYSPLNVKKLKVCAVSGELPGPHCKHLKEAWFIPGKSPIASCAVHREVQLEANLNYRLCPGEFDKSARHEVYEFWPSDLLLVFEKAGISRRTPPPYAPRCGPGVGSGIHPEITSPRRGISYNLRLTSKSQIPLSAVTDGDSSRVYWFINDEQVGTSAPRETLFWDARPGEFVVRAVDDQGRAAAQELKVQVVN